MRASSFLFPVYVLYNVILLHVSARAETLLDILSNSPAREDLTDFFNSRKTDFNVLYNFVLAGKMCETLDGQTPYGYTLFAPNDEAFMHTAQDLGLSAFPESEAYRSIFLALQRTYKDPIKALQDWISYHLLPQEISFPILNTTTTPSGDTPDEVLQANGIGRNGTVLIDRNPDQQDPHIIQIDIQASNGVMHVIDRVLFPDGPDMWVSPEPFILGASPDVTDEDPSATGELDISDLMSTAPTPLQPTVTTSTSSAGISSAPGVTGPVQSLSPSSGFASPSASENNQFSSLKPVPSISQPLDPSRSPLPSQISASAVTISAQPSGTFDTSVTAQPSTSYSTTPSASKQAYPTFTPDASSPVLSPSKHANGSPAHSESSSGETSTSYTPAASHHLFASPKISGVPVPSSTHSSEASSMPTGPGVSSPVASVVPSDDFSPNLLPSQEATNVLPSPEMPLQQSNSPSTSMSLAAPASAFSSPEASGQSLSSSPSPTISPTTQNDLSVSPTAMSSSSPSRSPAGSESRPSSSSGSANSTEFPNSPSPSIYVVTSATPVASWTSGSEITPDASLSASVSISPTHSTGLTDSSSEPKPVVPSESTALGSASQSASVVTTSSMNPSTTASFTEENLDATTSPTSTEEVGVSSSYTPVSSTTPTPSGSESLANQSSSPAITPTLTQTSPIQTSSGDSSDLLRSSTPSPSSSAKSNGPDPSASQEEPQFTAAFNDGSLFSSPDDIGSDASPEAPYPSVPDSSAFPSVSESATHQSHSPTPVGVEPSQSAQASTSTVGPQASASPVDAVITSSSPDSVQSGEAITSSSTPSPSAPKASASASTSPVSKGPTLTLMPSSQPLPSNEWSSFGPTEPDSEPDFSSSPEAMVTDDDQAEAEASQTPEELDASMTADPAEITAVPDSPRPDLEILPLNPTRTPSLQSSNGSGSGTAENETNSSPSGFDDSSLLISPDASEPTDELEYPLPDEPTQPPNPIITYMPSNELADSESIDGNEDLEAQSLSPSASSQYYTQALPGGNGNSASAAGPSYPSDEYYEDSMPEHSGTPEFWTTETPYHTPTEDWTGESPGNLDSQTSIPASSSSGTPLLPSEGAGSTEWSVGAETTSAEPWTISPEPLEEGHDILSESSDSHDSAAEPEVSNPLELMQDEGALLPSGEAQTPSVGYPEYSPSEETQSLPQETVTPGMNWGDTWEAPSSIEATPEKINGDAGGACFPASAVVHLPGGDKAVSALEAGELVKSSETAFSAVYLFSHKQKDVLHTFVQVITDMHNVTLTPGHYLYANGKLTAAKKVRKGDLLRTLEGEARVKRVRRVKEVGLFAPHTITGDLVVNRVLVSCYTTAVRPWIAHAALWPLRLLVRLGFREPLGGLLYDGAPNVLRWLPG